MRAELISENNDYVWSPHADPAARELRHRKSVAAANTPNAKTLCEKNKVRTHTPMLRYFGQGQARGIAARAPTRPSTHVGTQLRTGQRLPPSAAARRRRRARCTTASTRDLPK